MDEQSSGVVQVEIKQDEDPPSTPEDPPACTQTAPKVLIKKNSKERTRPSNPTTEAFRREFYPSVTDIQWDDWRWQLKNRIGSLAHIKSILRLSQDEESAFTSGKHCLPAGVTPYYMSLLSQADPNHPLRRSVIPTINESIPSIGEADDPLGEEGQSPVPGLVHRYPDRVLLLLTDSCSTYCRYCTRSRTVGHGRIKPDKDRLAKAVEYIRSRPEVRDVLLSGGDPLTLHNGILDRILSDLQSIPHVEMIRMGTKVPAVLPQRITPQLTNMLRKHHPLWLSLHFTHPEECTPETTAACSALADAGIPLGSQTVLLKGINDDPQILKTLFRKLLSMRVRPYYLYQCDPITGSAHFRTPVSKGLEVIQALRGHTTGYAVPTYVIDAPGGGGKIPLSPDYVAGKDENGITLVNYEGKTFSYPDHS
jgi:lysine 2,3-aminomutase